MTPRADGHGHVAGDRMQPLYVGIRHKLTSVLEQWHPSDPSAHAMLLPWLDVFLPADMEVLLARSILPKLVMALRDFVINPASQEMGTGIGARGEGRCGLGRGAIIRARAWGAGCR